MKYGSIAVAAAASYASSSEDIKIKFICEFSHNKNYTQGLSCVSGNENEPKHFFSIIIIINGLLSYPFIFRFFSVGPSTWYVALAATKIGPFMEIKIMSRRHMHAMLCYPFRVGKTCEITKFILFIHK